jgi:hypothetical protein
MSNFFNSGYWSNFHSLAPWTIFLIALFALIIYLFPTIVAVLNKKRQAAAIFILNLFTGWTGIGWLAALIWAAIKEKTDAVNN